jgi:predicted Zn-dependent protease
MTTKTPSRSKKATAGAVVEKVEDVVIVESPTTPLEGFLDAQRRALKEFGKAVESLIPEPVQEHTKNAYKEAVEGYRILLNSAIDDIVERIEKVKITTTDRLTELQTELKEEIK